MDPTTSDQGVVRPFLEGLLTISPSPFFLQFLQLWLGVLNGILGIFGLPPIFTAL